MHLDSSFPARSAPVGRCFGHALDTICDLRVEIDGHRIEVAVEEIGIDPQCNAGILVSEHPRHRKDIRTGADSKARCGVPQIVQSDRLHLRALDRPIEPSRLVVARRFRSLRRRGLGTADRSRSAPRTVPPAETAPTPDRHQTDSPCPSSARPRSPARPGQRCGAPRCDVSGTRRQRRSARSPRPTASPVNARVSTRSA